MLEIKIHDFRQNRERRIVDNDASVWILRTLVVSAGKERTDDFSASQPVLCDRPVFYYLVNPRRRVTVVCCLLRFELVNELLILGIRVQ